MIYTSEHFQYIKELNKYIEDNKIKRKDIMEVCAGNLYDGTICYYIFYWSDKYLE